MAQLCLKVAQPIASPPFDPVEGIIMKIDCEVGIVDERPSSCFVVSIVDERPCS